VRTRAMVAVAVAVVILGFLVVLAVMAFAKDNETPARMVHRPPSTIRE
jgi:hypothetical protein